MLSAFTNSLKIPELRQKIFFTLALLFIARVGANIPLPGVDPSPIKEFFEDLSKGKGPANSILALGYAGWGPGQIEKELLANSWMTLAADSTFLFDDEVANKWNKAYGLLGIDPNKLSQFSGRA